MQMPETPAGKDKTRAAGLWYGDLALGWLHGVWAWSDMTRK